MLHGKTNAIAKNEGSHVGQRTLNEVTLAQPDRNVGIHDSLFLKPRAVPDASAVKTEEEPQHEPVASLSAPTFHRQSETPSSAACGVAGVPADLRIYGLSEHIVLRRPPSPGIVQYRPSAALQEFLTFCAVKNNERPRKKRRMPSKEHGKSPRQEDWYLDVPYFEKDECKQRGGRLG